MSKAKYKKGKRIRTISEFDQSPCLWYKFRDKTVHRSFLISWQYRTLLNAINSGFIFECDEVLKDD